MRRTVALACAAGLWLLPAPAAQAQTATPVPVSGTTVTITDTAFTPNSLLVSVGQTVTWTNKGQNVHAAASDNGISPSFDSGGLGPGQSFSFTFTGPGSFPYHSPIDQTTTLDSFGNTVVVFLLTGQVVVQTGPVATATSAATPVPAATATPIPQPCQFVLGFATLAKALPKEVGSCLDSQAFAPNGDSLQHTTGGLLVWRKADNWTAFTDGYRTWINGPNGIQQRLNTARFPWEPVTPPTPTPGPPTPVPTAAPPSPTPTPTGPPVVSIDDSNGFVPATVNIKVGQSVTWTNKGQNVHSAVTNSGVSPSFDSGGLGNGQSYTFSFGTAGSYPYHSSIEQQITTDGNGNTIVTYQFNGTIVVS